MSRRAVLRVEERLLPRYTPHPQGPRDSFPRAKTPKGVQKSGLTGWYLSEQHVQGGHGASGYLSARAGKETTRKGDNNNYKLDNQEPKPEPGVQFIGTGVIRSMT
ncbi:hypothetical protein N7532_008673 [Penicillium argentinense]|uniref:Uncharacterized protein n=1 Tax=Penicillium argentinense TaxID=1131581 RepID=A0A9W9EXU7_9EURO|nr:uncharacterized protein N7532_008673 [Penicillium argentinense]KAJ5089989.1 hypothetical protein N7532_008673 [Penicillium argentinense]